MQNQADAQAVSTGAFGGARQGVQTAELGRQQAQAVGQAQAQNYQQAQQQAQQNFQNKLTKHTCLLYTSPSPRDGLLSRMPSSA